MNILLLLLSLMHKSLIFMQKKILKVKTAEIHLRTDVRNNMNDYSDHRHVVGHN